MPGARLVTRLERLTWVFVFGGLATLVLGLAARDFDMAAAWALMVAGAVATGAGILLIWVRSRLPDDSCP